MPETLFTVQSDEPGWRPGSAPDAWELTHMVVDAINEALGHDPLEQRPVGRGPASITTGPPWGFESPVDCEQETIDLLTALASTDEPLDALVTGQLHRGVAPEEVTSPSSASRCCRTDAVLRRLRTGACMTVTPPPPPPPLSELERYLGDLAREMLGPDVSPVEIRAFVVGQTAGLMRAHYPSDTPQQLRRRVVHGAGFLRARRIAEDAMSNTQLDPGQA